MPSPSEPERRYPKRRGTAVSYSEVVDGLDELHKSCETAIVVTANNTADNNGAMSSDNDEDWEMTHKKRSKISKTKKPKTQKPKPFPFMRLPAELREEMYKFVVGSHDGTVNIESSPLINPLLRRTLREPYWSTHDQKKEWADLIRFRNLRLLRVSKAIYQEAAVVMYTRQKFVFTSLSTLQTFLLLLRPETLDRVTHVQVFVIQTEWHLMPGVALQMLQLRYLQTFEFPRFVFWRRDFAKYLDDTGRPQSTWPVNVESFDKIQAIKLAKDTYSLMFPFFNAVIRAGPGDAEEPLQLAPSKERNEISSNDSQSSMMQESNPNSTDESGAHTVEEEEPIYKPLIGVDALVRVMAHDQNFELNWSGLSRQSPWTNSILSQFKSAPMTEERRSVRRAALKKELLALMAQDSF